MGDVFRIQPSGRSDEWAWEVLRARRADEPTYLADWLSIGNFVSEKRAQAFVDRGGEPEVVEPPPPVVVDQMDLFLGGAN